MFQRNALLKDSVATDDLYRKMLRDVQFQSQQLLNVSYAGTDGTPDKLGLEHRKLIVVKDISRQAAITHITTINLQSVVRGTSVQNPGTGAQRSLGAHC